MYTDIIHLPVEFPLPLDGHRPVSEDFRDYADNLIKKTWTELGFQYNTVTGSIEDRVAQIIDILGLERSSTLENPQEKDDGTLWYERIEDILGPREGRYFSEGFKKSDAYIYDVNVDPKARKISAKVDFKYPPSWSIKGGKTCERHLSTNDALLVVGQLAQVLMYTTDGLTREISNNMWSTGIKITPKVCISRMEGIPFELTIVQSEFPEIFGKKYHSAVMQGRIGKNAWRVDHYGVTYELPK